MQTELKAPDISCAHCAMTIKRELGPVEGVVSVDVDVPSRTVSLEYEDGASLDRAKAMLAEIGYPAATS